MEFSLALCLVIVLSVSSSWGQLPPIRPQCLGVGNNAFEKNCIVSDLIDVAPTEILKVQYTGGLNVNLGNELTPTQVKDAPSVAWTADPTALYTLSEADLDAPSRANFSRSPIIHWLVVNIPGSNLAGGEVLMPYAPAKPPTGMGLHRYVFLLIKQAGRLDTAALKPTFDVTKRANFDVRQFAKSNALGNPQAGNFFQAQFQSPNGSSRTSSAEFLIICSLFFSGFLIRSGLYL